MTRFVIINGDDFGLSQAVNQGIIQAYQQGILTSTSLMVTGTAFDEAVNLAKSNPNLAVGLHLVLVCAKSALSASEIPDLVDEKGNFSNDSVKAGLNYQFNSQARQQLYKEIRAQLEKFAQTGLTLSHVDGHLHLHMHPVVLNILVDLAGEFNIPYIRLPDEELPLNLAIDANDKLTKIIWSFIFHRLRQYGEGLLKTKGIGYTQKVYGLLQTGKVTEEYLLKLIPKIEANIIEIYAHPATNSESQRQELSALLSQPVKDMLGLYGFQLTNYHQLSKLTPH